jgi:uncharacterized protein (TIGR02284 family)
MATMGTTSQTGAGQGTISVLQDLSARCHDSEQGYRRSAQDASDSDLKQQFEQLANERSSMASELDRLIRENGGEPSWTAGSVTGAAHRMWVDLRTALSSNQRQAILEEVARGESAAEEAYDDALRQDLPMGVRQTIREHHRRVRETRNRYRAMAGTGRATRRTGELAQRLTAGTGEAVTHYIHERPYMSSMVVFALGLVLGALIVSSIGADSGYSRGRSRSSHRFW